MKIGPVDFTYRLPVLLAVVICLVFYLWTFWRSKAETRIECFFRDDIVRGVFDENFDTVQKAASSCRNLLALRPTKINARLYLATILLRQKDNNKNALNEAQKIFKDVSTAANAKPEEKAWALVGAGVALFDTAAEGTAKLQVAGECEDLFKRAREQDPKNADALANLALVQLYHSPANLQEAEKLCQEALQAPQPPSLRAQTQLYSLRGWLLMCQGQAEAALAAYARALAIRPGHEELLQSRRLALLNAVTQPKLDPKLRHELLQTIEGSISQYGDYQVAAWNAIGLGWELLQQTPEYGAKAYENAMRQFAAVIQREPKAPEASVNRGTLLEQHVANLAGQLTAKITGLTAEAPRFNPWKDKEQSLSGPDTNLLATIKQTLQQEDENWQNFREKAAKPEQKAESLLRQLSCVRRMLWVTEASDKATLALLRDRALNLANELVKLEPENGEAQFALGEVLLEAGHWSAAFRALQSASAKHASFPGFAQLLEDLGRPPALGNDVRPGPLRRSFGRLPFVAATLVLPGYLEDCKEIKMALDGKDVPVIRIGAQFFHLSEKLNLPAGIHTVALSAVDATGATLTFPSFQFGAERTLPELKITPDAPAVISTKPKWTVVLNGADPNTINITLKSARLSRDRELIKDGRFKVHCPELTPPVAIGAACGAQFTVGAGLDLQPGAYTLIIEARDADGNVVISEAKMYTVQREGAGGGQP